MMEPEYTEDGRTVRARVLRTFREYGGWWSVQSMAYWINTKEEMVTKVYDKLEVKGLIDRQRAS